MMKIAQVLDTLYWGGAQKMQLFLVETLRPLGVDITVISLCDTADSPVDIELKKLGARVINFPFDRLFSPGPFLKLVQFVRAEKFDLIHAYLAYSNVVGPLAGLLTGTPSIASLRNADFERRSYTPQREFMETFSMRYFATRVMANGSVVADFARLRLKNKRTVDIVPNATDPIPVISEAERLQIRREITGDPNRPFVLSVGRLTEAKGFPDLLEAFVTVRAQFPDAALVIAGGGSKLEDLKLQIERLGMQNHIFLLGRRNDAPRLLVSADIYVNSSHWEGTPVSVLEAMAAGLPIIATKVGESPHLLNEDSGVLVLPHQPQELADALIALLASPEKRAQLGQIAYERMRRYYSGETWRRSLLDLYAQITPKAKPYLAQITNSYQTSEA
jgi:glycosyltransferase involved in cell wall biosynthesis